VKFTPDAGDFIWLELDPIMGHEQGEHRPVIVLTPQAYNELSRLCVACPVTSQSRGYPFEVPIPEDCGVNGVVLVNHIRNVSWAARYPKFIGTAPPKLMEEVREKLALLLGID
jgi:mRNA interferase MazF